MKSHRAVDDCGKIVAGISDVSMENHNVNVEGL